MIWRGVELCCPACRGELIEEGRGADPELHCVSCRARYPVILGIPDLRIFDDPYITREADRAKARMLAERSDDLDFAGLAAHYYASTPVVTAAQARSFIAGLLAAEARAEATLDAWEGTPPTTPRAQTLLEIGCGTGPMLLAAGSRYASRIGIDIAFRWLVVGQKRLQEAGADIPTLCACAEALPFPDAIADVVVGDAVIENVRDQRRTVAEAHRVLRPGGRIHLTTSNRRSIGPDPQTGIWAVGWLPPDRVTARVERGGGIPPKRTLLAPSELRGMLRDAGFAGIRLGLPTFPAAQRAQFPAPLRAIATVYGFATRVPVARQALMAIGPKFLATASKPPSAS